MNWSTLILLALIVAIVAAFRIHIRNLEFELYEATDYIQDLEFELSQSCTR